MNSLKHDDVQKSPQAILPPEPTAPTEIINDPLFEPVEVIQEGNEDANATTDLNQVAQKIKEESLQNTPVTQKATIQPITATAPAVKTNIQSSPVTSKIAAPAKMQKTNTVSAVNEKKVTGTAVIKQNKPEIKKTVEPKKTIQAASIKSTTQDAVTPTVAAKPAEVKNETTQTTYYIQVGSFTNEPSKVLFDRLNASGMKYITQKNGTVTKILVGPFQGEKSVQDAMGNIRQNVEAKAFKIKG
jgi:cell division protein FtsN